MEIDLDTRTKLLDIKKEFSSFLSQDEIRISENKVKNRVMMEVYGFKSVETFPFEIDKKALIMGLRPIILSDKSEKKWENFVKILRTLNLDVNRDIEIDFIKELEKNNLGRGGKIFSRNNNIINSVLSIDNKESRRHIKLINNSYIKELNVYCIDASSSVFFKEVILYAKYYHRTPTAIKLLELFSEEEISYSIDSNLYKSTFLIANSLIIIDDILDNRDLLEKNLDMFKLGAYGKK